MNFENFVLVELEVSQIGHRRALTRAREVFIKNEEDLAIVYTKEDESIC